MATSVRRTLATYGLDWETERLKGRFLSLCTDTAADVLATAKELQIPSHLCLDHVISKCFKIDAVFVRYRRITSCRIEGRIHAVEVVLVWLQKHAAAIAKPAMDAVSYFRYSVKKQNLLNLTAAVLKEHGYVELAAMDDDVEELAAANEKIKGRVKKYLMETWMKHAVESPVSKVRLPSSPDAPACRDAQAAAVYLCLQFLLKLFRLKRPVETRFIYLYDSVNSVLKFFIAVCTALVILREMGLKDVPVLDESMRPGLEKLLTILKALRLAIAAVSGSKTPSLAASVKAWIDVVRISAADPTDSADMKSFRAELVIHLT
jgi:hypothetical protein